MYRLKLVILLSVKKENECFVIEGMFRNDPSDKIKLILDRKTGNIKKSYCRPECSSHCEHILALALCYNETSVEGLDPIEQLTSFSLKNSTLPKEQPFKIEFDKKNIEINVGQKDAQMSRLLKKIDRRSIPELISIFPERFFFSGNTLKAAETPLDIMYSVKDSKLRFFLPEKNLYFDDSGVVIDIENGLVWRLDEKANGVLSTFLNLSMEYKSRDELAGVIHELSANLEPLMKLHGEINVEKVILDENTAFVFDTWLENRKIFIKIFFQTESGTTEFKPKRKNFDQVYPVNGRIYLFTPALIKKLRRALNDSGVKFSKKNYIAPVEKYYEIISPDSTLNKLGKVVLRKEPAKFSFDEKGEKNSEIEFDINVNEKWFSFRIKLPESNEHITPEELISAIRQIDRGVENPLILDSSGNPVILEKSRAFLERISTMLPAKEGPSLKKIHFGNLLKILNTDSRKAISSFSGDKNVEKTYKKIFSTMKHGKLPDISLPKEIKTKLRHYQTEGLKWLTLLRDMGLGGVLADEMGLGKTVQSLAMIKMESGEKPSMVIAPKTLLWSWDREIEKFFPEMDRVVIDSLKPEDRRKKWKESGNELLITSYSVVVNDLDLLKDKEFETVILDEAQHIKNCKTKRFKSLVAVKAKYRFALTGTPIENHLRDLWSIFQFVMPGYLGSRKDVDKIENTHDDAGLKKLSLTTAPFILRRTKKEILSELPELTVKEYPVEMTQKQKEAYLTILLRSRAEYIENKDSMSSIQILSILSKLRLAANHPSLVGNPEASPDTSGKILTVLELVDEIISSNGKVLIFSQYVKMLSLVEMAIKKTGIEYFYMDGGTKNRMAVVDRFNNGEKPLFLMSLKVGGVGLNLAEADNVIIVDPWWNPAAEEQAWSRAHRIGQKKRVIVNKLFSKGTIEEKIMDMQNKKKGMTDALMSKALKHPSEDFIKKIAEMELALSE